ncbi:glycosyltransferase [Christiangramia echinicola]|uniref:glycosyltransferase n=1 Tax=Christiangramia echinicola TaxID=279359 RepID=UPI001560228F
MNLNKTCRSRETTTALKPIIKAENPRIIHTTLFRSEMAGRRLKAIFPEIILVGSFVSNSYSKHRYGLLSIIDRLKLLSTEWRDKATANKVDFFISNSYAIKENNIKVLGVPEEKVEVIYRGRSKATQYYSDTKRIIKELKLQDKKVFLNISRLQESKGQLVLIKAFKNFIKIYPGSVLLIAGEGIFRKELEKFIEINQLTNVHLLGYRTDISNILAISDFFIFPSYYEGLPGAVIESIFSRTPVIISDIPENRECLPANTALIFKVGNILEIQKKMEEALKIKDWDIRTKAAYHYAVDRFNIDEIGEKYEKFYLKIENKVP